MAQTYAPQRGRPTAKQAAAIDAAILGTAKKLFLERGFDRVSMDAVAATAGVSKGTLYQRYPDKSSLFVEIVRTSIPAWQEVGREDIKDLSGTLAERLKYHMRSIALSYGDPEVLAFRKLLDVTRDRFPELSRAMYDFGYTYIINLISRDIEIMADQDAVPASQSRSVAQILVGAVTGWHMQESATRSITVEELIAFGERAVDVVLAGRTGW